MFLMGQTCVWLCGYGVFCNHRICLWDSGRTCCQVAAALLPDMHNELVLVVACEHGRTRICPACCLHAHVSMLRCMKMVQMAAGLLTMELWF